MGMGWWVDGVWALMEARLLLSGLEPSIFMPSGSDTWYLIDSFSSILVTEDDGDEAPGSGDTSLGGVGGKVYRWELEWDGGVSEDAEAALELLPHGYTAERAPGDEEPGWCRLGLLKGLTAQALWW